MRRQIVDVAAELFAVRTYHGTGIEELSRALGMGRGSLYHHIGSKEALLYAICSSDLEEMIAIAREAGDGGGAAEPRLRALLCELMRHIAANAAAWTVFFRDSIALTGERLDRVVALRAEFERLLADLIEDGTRRGEFRAVDPVIVKGILGQFNYAYLWIHGEGRLPPEQVAAVFCDVLVDGLARQDEAA